HLRIAGTRSGEPPGFLRVLGRTMLFYMFANLALDLITLFRGPNPDFAGLLALLSMPIGVLVMISSMRARNGYRGLYELWSGPRVIRLPWPKNPQLFVSRRPDRWTALVAKASRPDRLLTCPRTMGPFQVRAALAKSGDEQLLLAEDSILGRKVLLQCRP